MLALKLEDPLIRIQLNDDGTSSLNYDNGIMKKLWSQLLESIDTCSFDRDEIISVDVPERLQSRHPAPVTGASKAEVERESKWVYDILWEVRKVEGGSNNRDIIMNEIKEFLNCLRNEKMDIPLIAKDVGFIELNSDSMWEIYRADAEFCQLERVKKALLEFLDHAQIHNEDAHRPIMFSDFDAIMNAASVRELRDVFMLVHVLYGKGLSLKIGETESIASKEENGSLDDNKASYRTKLLTVAGQFDFKSVTESIRRGYSCPIEQHSFEPLLSCVDLVTRNLKNTEHILEFIKLIAAAQLGTDADLRSKLLELFRTAKVSVRPTSSGFVRIDENHPLYSMKYLKDKPVSAFKEVEFLKLVIAERNELIKMRIEVEGLENFLDYLKKLCTIESSDYFARKWNEVRLGALQIALNQILLPSGIEQLRATLLQQDYNFILKKCSENLRQRLSIGPYQPQLPFEQRQKQGGDKCLRVLAVAYDSSENPSVYCAFLNRHGCLKGVFGLQNMLVDDSRVRRKQRDLRGLKNFIRRRSPHVVAICGTSRTALKLQDDIQNVILELNKEGKLPLIDVEILDSELAVTYAYSEQGEAEFPDYPSALKQAICVGRQIHDPIIAYAQLSPEELTGLRYHDYQDYVPKEELMGRITSEFVNLANEIGIDVNRAIAFPHNACLLGYASGLGPVKAQGLLERFHQAEEWPHAKTELLSIGGLGSNVFRNCADFVQIDIRRLRRACSSEDVNNNENQFENSVGNKDSRKPYETPSREEIFRIVLKVPLVKVKGKLVQCQVTVPYYTDIDAVAVQQSSPVLNKASKKWQCIFCKREFKTEIDVGNHFFAADEQRCRGKLEGFKVRLDCGLNGFITTRRLSDRPIFYPYDQFRRGLYVTCRIGHVDVDSLMAECSARASDVADVKGRFAVRKDEYYGFDTEFRYSQRC